jgi:hypothetical protein
MRPAIRLSLILFAALATPANAQLYPITASPYHGKDEPIEALIAGLREPTLLRSVVWKLEGAAAEERIVPALHSAFDDREGKEEKQWIAVALLRMGDRHPGIYQFLAQYAREAIEDRTPYFQTPGVRGQFSPEFEAWCLANQADPRAVAARQLGDHPDAVRYLAEATDIRARDLLRQGLESPNPGVVMYSIQGLARLQDTDALPQIAVTTQKIGSFNVVMELAWYGSREAYALMERLEPDPKLRRQIIDQVEGSRRIEQVREAQRTGKAQPK